MKEETVVIDTKNGPVVINKCDLKKEHVLYLDKANEEPKEEKPKKKKKNTKQRIKKEI